MTSQWGYVDPVQRVHQQRAERAMWQQPPAPAPSYYSPEPVQSPLAGLDFAVPQIMGAAGLPVYRNVGAAMAEGAALGGLLGLIFGRRMARRAQRVQELKESLGIADIE